MWRSLVAHLTGGQGVAGSNPVIPTNLLFFQEKHLSVPTAIAITVSRPPDAMSEGLCKPDGLKRMIPTSCAPLAAVSALTVVDSVAVDARLVMFGIHRAATSRAG